MAPTGYTVASAASLLGAKPPQRREIEDVYYARRAATDKYNRERSKLQRMPEVRRKEPLEGVMEGKKVRFTPSAVWDADDQSSTNSGGMKEEDAEDEEISRADTSQAAATTPTREKRKGVVASSASALASISARAGSISRANSLSSSSEAGTTTTSGPHGSNNGARAPNVLRTRQAPDGKEPGHAAAAAVTQQAAVQHHPSAGLPLAHSHRLTAIPKELHPVRCVRIDTSGGRQDDDSIGSRRSRDTIPGGYTASPSSSADKSTSTSKDKGSLLEDPPATIYFTPIDVDRSTIEFEFFNAPMSAPRVLGSDESTLERGESSSSNSPRFQRGKAQPPQYPQARRLSFGLGHTRRRSSTKGRKEKITLAPEQLDRLVVALANAPLVHSHLRKQWLEDEDEEDEQQDKPSMLSFRSALLATQPTDSMPSLTNESTASNNDSKSSSSLYSRPNSTFVNESESQSSLDEYDNDEDVEEHPLARSRPRARFGGIAICDPKVHGAPIRFISKNYQKGANVLQVGQCSFLNVPYGASADCILRIEPGDIAHGGAACRVTVQVMAQVVERKRGRKVYLLVAEVDVTESLTKAVLVELAKHTGFSLDDIEIIQPGPVRHDSFRESVDWCALADELQTSCSTNEIIEDAAAGFKSLEARSCTMQTLTLLSELERIKAQHVDFLVLRSTESTHDNGMPQAISIPWISQHLHAHVNLWSPEATGLFREDLVAAVGRRHADGEAFAVRVLWGRKKKICRCVPLLEGEGGRTAGWVAFVGDEFDF